MNNVISSDEGRNNQQSNNEVADTFKIADF